MYETKLFDNPAESSEKDKTYMMKHGAREPRKAVQYHECAAGSVSFRTTSRRAPGNTSKAHPNL